MIAFPPIGRRALSGPAPACPADGDAGTMPRGHRAGHLPVGRDDPVAAGPTLAAVADVGAGDTAGMSMYGTGGAARAGGVGTTISEYGFEYQMDAVGNGPRAFPGVAGPAVGEPWRNWIGPPRSGGAAGPPAIRTMADDAAATAATAAIRTVFDVEATNLTVYPPDES
jgi:hypothetical protein